MAAPMPNTITVEDKAVVPIVKTQIIRSVAGQDPVRTTEATIFEVKNGGKDIVAREVVLEENASQFSDKKMSAPIVQKGSVIVPTSKVEVKSTLSQGGVVLAEGIEFKKGQEPVRKELKLDQVKDPNSQESVTRAVLQENGTTTKDVVVVKEPE
ncbi:hypothetical protein LTR94_020252 [Friedmanniomyces endolithicus]|nr:hypothetical protein LTR94_020252 [Friedmanniomyces endolithicus]